MEKEKSFDEISGAMRSKEASDVNLVRNAYDFAKDAHKSQKRYSGDPYFIHVAAVGHTLAELGMDASTVAAGLLHDSVEDGCATEQEIGTRFGKDILFLVDGVTKLGKLKYRGAERHAENLRKLFVSTAKDPRVIIIKLADRLHNVRTLQFVPKEKRQRIALETLEIYAPIANRLSMGRIKGELEDNAFAYAYPEKFEEVTNLIKERSRENDRRLEKVYRGIQSELAKNGIISTHGEYRVKRTYSLYKKLQRNNMDINTIFDLSAIRVIVSSVADCYRALGIIHNAWRPLPGRIKDYIAFPKPNGYQSLHTTIFVGDGTMVEVQLRTEEMNREAKFGIAAHFAYKEKISSDKQSNMPKNLEWVKQMSELRESIDASNEYLEHLKMDFFEDRVFVFTPKGDVVDLPKNSSPIDFSFAIHSDIGKHTSGAIVNGKYVALDSELKNGDIVAIITKRSAKPTKKWLDYTKTSLARRHIRSFLQKEESEGESKRIS